ncbi:hypothetical protein ACFQ1L_23440 [Phytohabitans flavus]|nr:hypothetical protein [Phytohabitans flavus]
MVVRSGIVEPEPAGWSSVRLALRELWHEMRHPTPRAVRYMGCDGCGQVTSHSSDQRLYTLRVAERGVTAPPPKAVCDECGHAQPRAMGDEILADVPVTCAGRRHRRIRAGRSRRRCGQVFAAPAAATVVACPWCSTVQPGPAAVPSRSS